MNRSEAAKIATRAAQAKARRRRLEAAAELLREAGWTVTEPLPVGGDPAPTT